MNLVHIEQPTDYSCAPTVAAMYLGVSLEEAMRAMPDKKTGTETKALIAFLRAHGVKCQGKLTSAHRRALPRVAIVRIVWPDKKGHFVLKHDRTWLDPAMPGPFAGVAPADRKWSNGGRITSYLELPDG